MRKPRWGIWLPAILWMTVIFATSSTWISRDAFVDAVSRFIPGEALRNAFISLWDHAGLLFVKGYHMAEFALLFLLCRWALSSRLAWSARRATLWSASFCLLYAISDEWHQTFVPDRGGTWVDVVIDLGGVGLAALLVRRWERRKTAPVSLQT